jgi:predicted nucleotidyltransferase
MTVFDERATRSRARLEEVCGRVAAIPELATLKDLCIYVTGSYGRLEASTHSDLDLFLVHQGTRDANGVPRLTKIVLDAELIRAARDLGFPEFSNDGEFLEIHYLDDIKKALGSPADDFQNYFTARMLLLLESRPVYGAETYNATVKDIVNTYLRDYPEHADAFRPVFLMNDVLRFWKTLCLNYENKREKQKDKTKSSLRNLKLKFSRLMTCYSALALLVSKEETSEEEVSEMIRRTPLERLAQVRSIAGAEPIVERVLEHYEWFMATTDKPPPEMLGWMADKHKRKTAFERADKFGAAFYELLTKVGTLSGLRYLTI